MAPLRFACLLLAALAAPADGAKPAPPWKPPGALGRVLVVDDCTETAGDAMASRLDPPTIYVCPVVMKLVRRQQPAAETFFRAHEYGHIALQTADEAFADCWAAQALAGSAQGERAITAAIALFGGRPEAQSPRYGTPAGRAAHIRECADQARAGTETPQR